MAVLPQVRYQICIVQTSDRDGADFDYTFARVGVKHGRIATAANAGNMSAAVGPFTLREGLAAGSRVLSLTSHRGRRPELDKASVTNRLFNTNTSKIVRSQFDTVLSQEKFFPDEVGYHSFDGVPSRSPTLSLTFQDPGGSKAGRVLPTADATDDLQHLSTELITASLVDVSNPGVFFFDG